MAKRSAVLGLLVCVVHVPVPVSPALALSRRMTCIYTEPFVTTVYDPARRTLTIDTAAPKVSEIVRGVVAAPAGRGRLRFRKGSRSLQIVNLREKGSDGMSDRVFPYAGRFARGDVAGGCE